MDKIDELLIRHEIYPNYSGYEYIKFLIQEDIKIGLIKITTRYKFIAPQFNTTPVAIERSIRSVLNKSDLKGLSNKKALALLQVEYKGSK